MSRSAPFTCLVAILVLLGTSAVSASAQQNPLRITTPDASGGGASCVAGKFLGGFTGALVGGVIGAHIERAFYPDVPDAGLTGLSVGIIFGAIGGSMLAGRHCRDDGETYPAFSPSLAYPPRAVDTCLGVATHNGSIGAREPNERRLAVVRPVCFPGG